MTLAKKDYSRMTIKQLGNDVASCHYWYGDDGIAKRMIALRERYQIPVSMQEISREAKRQRRMHDVR